MPFRGGVGAIAGPKLGCCPEGHGRADAVAPAGAAGLGRAQRQGPHGHPGAEPAAHQPASAAAGRGRPGGARAGGQLGVLPARPRAARAGRWRAWCSRPWTAPMPCSCATAGAPRPCERSARRRRRPTSRPMPASGTASAPCTWPRRDVEAVVSEALGAGPFDLLLDLGTGTGRMLELFRDRYRRGLGIDLSPAMLAYARAKLERGETGRAHVRQGDIYDLPLADQSRRRRGDASGAALPERPAARRARGGARAGAGRTPADRRFRAPRARVPARAVRARAPGLLDPAGRASGWPIAGSSWSRRASCRPPDRCAARPISRSRCGWPAVRRMPRRRRTVRQTRKLERTS